MWLYLNENAAAPADDGTAFISYLGYDGYAQNSRWVEMGSDFRSVLYQPLGSATKTTVSFSQGEVDALASSMSLAAVGVCGKCRWRQCKGHLQYCVYLCGHDAAVVAWVYLLFCTGSSAFLEL